MHQSLWRLLFFRMRGGARRQLRRLATLRGLIALLTGLILLFLVASNRENNHAAGYGLEIFAGAESFRLSHNALGMVFAILACFTLLVSSGPAIYFNPAETIYLLSGPFTRRDLLLYKFCSFAIGLLFTGVLVALLSTNQSTFLAALFGTVNAMLFIQLLSAAVSLIEIKLQNRGWRFFRSGFTFFFCLIVFACVWHTLNPINAKTAALANLAIAPFLIFSKTFLAPNLWPELFVWCSFAWILNGCLVFFLIRLNVDFREDVIAKSQNLHSRWVKATRSGIWSDRNIRATRIPYFLGRSPIGILIWRQTASSLRIYRSVLTKLALLALCWGPILCLVPASLSNLSIGLSIWVCLFLLPKVISFDFRSDWDHMAILRTLPISPIRISFAQLITPVLITSFLEFTAILTTLPFFSDTGRTLLMATATLLLPLNLIIYAGDNLYFLLFPAPLTPIGRMDFEFFGRSIIELFIRSLLIGTAIGFSILGGGILANLGMTRLHATVLTAWLVVIAMAIFILPVMGWAFRRFPATE